MPWTRIILLTYEGPDPNGTMDRAKRDHSTKYLTEFPRTPTVFMVRICGACLRTSVGDPTKTNYEDGGQFTHALKVNNNSIYYHNVGNRT